MKLNKIIFPLFILLALIQLYVPASMIWAREVTLNQGKIYKFKTAPVDPYDPFRGKFINLQFEVEEVKVDNASDFEMYQQVYVLLEEDENGFAKIKAVKKEPPTDQQDYFTARVNFNYKETLRLGFPFHRYYMEESKAKPAELEYNNRQRTEEDSNVYALVSVRQGDAVLKDVMIDGKSIKDIVADQ